MKDNLIVYYSYTGHCTQLVNLIKNMIDCDICELVPEVPYPDDYQYVTDMSQVASDEQYVKPKLKPLNVNVEDYSKIIVVYPVWWYKPAAPIYTFFDMFDLSGKIVVPCATNAGWLGKGLSEISKIARGAMVVNDISILFTEDYKENKMKTDINEIMEWVKRI